MNASTGHLSVYVEGGHPAEVPFQFERQSKRLGLSVVLSLLFDAAFIALVVFVSRLPVTTKGFVFTPDETPSGIIWLSQPGPGGGGGGGGNQMKEPPRQAELPGKNKITVPVSKPPELEAPKETKNDPQPVQELTIPAQTMASNAQDIPGVLTAPPPGPPTASQGSGTGGGSGTGTGTGVGQGNGSGLGQGTGGGTGGGAYRLGSGVTSPVDLFKPKPSYTAEAMRARIQGSVLVECVVQTSGVCTDIQVVRSLDPVFGLDQEAIKSVRQWRFRPGTRLGQPVPVLVTIEVEFALR
jgi:TonB family protein